MTIASAEMSTALSSSAIEDEFLLKWHDHHQSFFLLVEDLVVREQLTDVTLSCGGDSLSSGYTSLSAHSLMLSVCSPYFRSLLSENKHKEKHHIIHLHGVSAKHMQQLLWYMYRGELSISQEDLAPLIETARCLQIKGLAMAATPNPVPPNYTPAKKRTISQMLSTSESSSTSHKPSKQVNNALSRALVPADSPSRHEFGGVDDEEVEEGALVVNTEYDPMEHQTSSYYNKGRVGSTPHEGNQLSPVSLPLLPKPLSVLKTAETRTYLSKLVWLGNGGRRPQYGNPETKPCWWPQHILPWEDMKKMGGRKSAELTNINYTEVLKQCLAAGYEYFGYDPATYFSTEVTEVNNSFLVGDRFYQTGPDDGHFQKGGGNSYIVDNSLGIKDDSVMKNNQNISEDSYTENSREEREFMEEEEDSSRQEGVLEIDLDQVKSDQVRGGKEEGEQNQILCNQAAVFSAV